jgi:predicted ATPase
MDVMWERFRLAHAHRKTGRPEEGLAEVAKLQALSETRSRHGLDAELFQLKGELLLMRDSGKIAEAEQCFRNAIETARRQSAKGLELPATTHLARLLARQDRRAEARAMLSEIYNWFTEGFDTADLKEAKALLDQLSE